MREAEGEPEVPPAVVREQAGARPWDGIWRFTGALAVLTFVVHVLAANRMHVPIIQGDEAGYLGNARYIVSGIGRTHAGYAAGYSLLLVPPTLLSHDPLTVYHLALVVNALLAAALPLLAVFLARRVFPRASTTALVVTALLVVLYPGWSTIANMALSENALGSHGARHCVRNRGGATIDAPLVCGRRARASYTCAVNPRGILVVAAFAIAVVVATEPWKRRGPAIAALAVAFVGTVAGRVLNIAVAGTSHVAGVKGDAGGQALKPLLHPHLWNDAAANILGRVAYTSIATFGVAIAGALVLAFALARRPPAAAADSLFPVAAFALPALVLTLVVSALSAVQVPLTGVDYLVYGRYVDGVLAPVLVLGAAWLFDQTPALARRAEVTRALVVGAVLAVVVLAFALIRPPAIKGAGLNIANVLALRIYVVHLHWSLPAVLLAGVALTTVVLLAVAVDRRLGAACMLVFFAFSSWTAYNDYAVHDSIGRARQHVLVEAIERLRALGVDTSCVLRDNAAPLSLWHIANYEFFVPASAFPDPTPPVSDCGPLIVSADARADISFPGARPVSFENDVPMGLWVILSRVPLPVRLAILEQGLVGPVPVTAALPNAAYRSSITVAAQSMSASQLRLRLGVVHVGAGAPWPGSFSPLQAKGVGLVRFIVTVSDAAANVRFTGRCPVPRTMLPGEATTSECVVKFTSGGRPSTLPTGRYTVRVGLIQEGVTAFSTKGDTSTVTLVTIH